jgi:hypothetical protein
MNYSTQSQFDSGMCADGAAEAEAQERISEQERATHSEIERVLKDSVIRLTEQIRDCGEDMGQYFVEDIENVLDALKNRAPNKKVYVTRTRKHLPCLVFNCGRSCCFDEYTFKCGVKPCMVDFTNSIKPLTVRAGA